MRKKGILVYKFVREAITQIRCFDKISSYLGACRHQYVQPARSVHDKSESARPGMALPGRGRSGILAAPARRVRGAETYRLADRVTVSAEIVDGTDILYRRDPKQVHAIAWS